MVGELSNFDRWWMDSWFHRWHVRRFVPRFLRACPEPFRGEVLEAGAGGGWTSRRILDIFPQVELTAFDVDQGRKEEFEKLRKIYGKRLNFREADLQRLPFDRESFDIVVAMHVLHHIDDPELGVRQLIRVTRPGGLIGIAGRSSAKLVGVRMVDITNIMKDEDCEVLISEGDKYYYVWAKKPYPIQPGGVE